MAQPKRSPGRPKAPAAAATATAPAAPKKRTIKRKENLSKTVEYEIITVHYGPDPDGWPPSTPELYVEKEVDLDPNRNR